MHGKTRSIPLFVSDARSASLLRYRLRADDEDLPDDTLCESSGPSLVDNIDLARFWDNVVLTDDESQALRALRLVFGDTVQGAAMVAHGRRTRHERHAIVKITGQSASGSFEEPRRRSDPHVRRRFGPSRWDPGNRRGGERLTTMQRDWTMVCNRHRRTTCKFWPRRIWDAQAARRWIWWTRASCSS